MNGRCAYCHRELTTGEVNGICGECKKKQDKNITYMPYEQLVSDLAELERYRAKGPVEELERVVRCKDCKHVESVIAADTKIGFCDHEDFVCYGITGKHYCSRGERREKV
ncbi:MAG: hypothetical protein PHE61_08855 [Candidatus Omnitrophica bacterium]|nr:hypothetical protein [Candidatus Omnitrophota bacterium]